MAENIEKTKQYQYTANSNLVLQADRNSLPRRDQEPSGEPESLFGKIDPRAFGSKALRDTTQLVRDKERKRNSALQPGAAASHEHDEVAKLERARRKKTNKALSGGYGYSSILAATEDFEGLAYRPRTKETRATYELILSFVHELLGDQTQDVIRSATDTVLRTLKDENLKDFDKKREIESIVGPFSSERFAQAVNLSKKLTDYQSTDAADEDAAGGDGKDDTLDEQLGVAVLFDEDEADEDVQVFEVQDASDDDDEEEDEADTEAQQRPPGAKDDADARPMEIDDEETFVVGQTEAAEKKRAAKKAVGTTGLAKDKLEPHDIDAFWLQRFIGQYYPDPQTASEKTDATMKILADTENIDIRDCENELMGLYDYDKFDLVKMLTKNRDMVYWCTRLIRAAVDQRPAIEEEMKQKGAAWIIRDLAGERTRRGEGRARKGVVEGAMEMDELPPQAGPETVNIPAVLPTKGAVTDAGANSAPRAVLDLDALAFSQGGHLMSNKKCKLPEGSFKKSEKGYEEIHVPAPKARPFGDNEKLIPISSLPEWSRVAFKGAKELNRVQSKLYPAAFGSDGNLLLCAPTGAGKTNVAMLTILHEIEKMRNKETGDIDLDKFKIVYIAPMKALVQEMVGNFGSRLEPFGIKVNELTGDRQLTKEQIAETQIIVTTPEKWDVITRKATDRSYTALVRLIIIDEIHLLHDDRGPVLESIVSRTIRNMEQTQEAVRLVGLSATLPNYVDVATFLRVDPKKGLYHFDSSFRPCPLKQEFIGVTEKKAIKRFQVMNEVCYNKVTDQAGKNQVLVFVHSRKETAKTAKYLRDTALEKDTIGQFIASDSASREILQTEAANCKDANLQDILPYGFGCHHAGMTREDRTLVEELFADGHLQVLVSTATLAWGVNLPAHTVIIKGTQVYSPEKGRWVELSPQDVLQMLGRAGRPQFDTFGEGIIITSHQELQYYLSLLNTQLPIESQFVSRMADNLNAEVVLGNIRSRDEAVQWLGYTYLYVRMLRNGALYGVTADDAREDPYLEQKRVDLVHSAATVLERCGLVRYDRKTGKLQGTELGRIASHYYITHHSMATYHQHLRPHMGLIELFRIFALSDEFKYIPVREEEKLEMAKLLERVPVPVKESVEEPAAKINVLLQSYISHLRLEGFALVSDMVYVTQSAGRIIRAVFEICLKRGWALLARRALGGIL